MKKIMSIVTAAVIILTLLFALIYNVYKQDLFLTLSITFGTISYHFCMRLMVGGIFNITMKNHADYNKKWYRVSQKERDFYEKINVKKWKNFMPTYDKSIFDKRLHSWDSIAQATCQAELVHETIIVLSFLPIITYVLFGALPVFVITSILAACFDGVFVIMQRYNRPRIIEHILSKKSA